jgi:hypothetical protein
VLEQGFPRHRSARPSGQERQEVELDSGQVDFLVAMMNPALLQIYSIVTERQLLVVFAPVHPSQQHLDPGDEFAHAERLGEVVVGADAESDQHVGLVAAGRQHQHRDRPLGLDAPADLESVEPRQHHIQNHQIRCGGSHRGDRRRAVDRGLHDEALGTQPGGARRKDGRLVVDHQDPLHTPDCRCRLWGFRAANVKKAWRNGQRPGGATSRGLRDRHGVGGPCGGLCRTFVATGQSR